MPSSDRKEINTPLRTPPEGSRRDMRLDNVRGMLILIVVIGHFLLPLYRTRFVTGLVYTIYVFHMPCFVMLSGYFARSAYRDGRFRWGKAVQILWLYLVYKLIVNVTEGLLAGSIPLFPDLLHESGAPWYLISLATFYLTVPVFHRFRRDPLRGFLTVAVMMAAVSFGKYFFQPGDFLSLDRSFSMLPYFWFGYYGTEPMLKSYLKGPWRAPVSVLACLLLAAAFFGTYDLFFKYHLVVYGADYGRYPAEMQGYLWALNLLWYLIAVCISLGVTGLAPARRIPVLTELGRRTLQIYILHRPIRDLMEYRGFYTVVDPHSKLQVIGIVLFSAVLAVLLGNRAFTAAFSKLRSLFDPLLEKLGGL